MTTLHPPRRRAHPSAAAATLALASLAIAPRVTFAQAPGIAGPPPPNAAGAAADAPSASTAGAGAAAAGPNAAAPAPNGATPAPAPNAPSAAGAAPPPEGALGALTMSAYVEAFYQWNFGRPANGITNYRGFDNRHNTLTIGNAALGAAWQKGPVSGQLTLQIGHTPNTYYLAEPASPGASGAGEASGPTTWKYLQQAYVGYRAPVGRGLLAQAGLFTSSVGHESMAVKDNWHWSRSNLFIGLPFYNAGVRATYELDDAWSLTAAVYNGWNSVVDNNLNKSFSLEATFRPFEALHAHLLYFGGVERAEGAPEGQPVRHDFDAFVRADLGARFAVLVHGNAGFESTAFGTSSWAAGALHGRYRAADWLYLALRGDYFRERRGENATGRAAAIFWPGDWVASATATADLRPAEGLSVRAEYRHDEADVAAFFRGGVGVDAGGVAAPDASSQDTLTFGATAWF